MADVRVDIDYSNPALEDLSLAAVPAGGLEAGEASRVALHVTTEEISCYERYGDDLVVVLRSGERLWLKDFFQSDDNGVAQLLVLDETTDGFAEISFADDGNGCLVPIVLASGAGAASGDGAAGGALPIGLGAVGLGGLAAVAFAATGGSEGSGKTPQSVRPDTEGNGTEGGQSGKPGGETDIDEGPEKPQGPAIEDLAVADNADGTITLSGRCEAGSTVRVAFTRGPAVKVDVGEDGRFSVHSPAGFAQRDGTVVVQATLGDATGPEKMIDYIDTIAPPAPAIDSAHDANGGEGDAITPDSKLVFTGTGEPISTVTVYLGEGDSSIVGGSGTVGMDGRWSIEYSHVRLTPRPYKVTAIQVDINGNMSVASGAFELNVQPASPDGTVDPEAPDNTGGPEGGNGGGDGGGEPGALAGPVVFLLWARENADGSIRAGGGTEPGSVVTVKFPDGSYATATADTDGAFETNSAVGVSQPDGSVYAQAKKGGERGPVEMIFYEVTVDEKPDQRPGDGDQAGGGETDANGGTEENETPDGPQVTGLVLGSNVDGTISISGRCEAGSTVEVTFPDGTTVSVDVGSGDSFDVESPAGIAQPEGPVRIVATKDDVRGPGATFNYVDSLNPLAPVIEGAKGDADGAGDEISVDPTLVFFYGTGEPGAKVVVSYEHGNGLVEIGAAVVGENGRWSVERAETKLEPGDYVFRAQQTDVNGLLSPHSDAFELTMDRTAPPAPVISRVEGDTGEQDGITSDTTLVFHGTGEPGARVVVFFTRGKAFVTIGDAVVGEDGRWSVDHTDTGFAPGDYVVKAQQTYANGLSSPHSDAFELTVVAPAELPVPRVTGIAEETVMPGLNDLYTSDRTVTFLGEGEPGARIDMYLNQKSENDRVWIGETEVRADGSWQLDYTHATLALDQYDVQARQTNVAGVSSGYSDSFTLYVIPEAPVITGVDEDTGESASDGVTSDTTLATYGTNGEPGALVELFMFDGKRHEFLDETRVEPDGTWRVDHTHTPLAEGTYELLARQTSESGMMSRTTGAYRLVVEPATNPTGPEVEDLVLAKHVNGAISVSGRCEVGSTVEVTFPDGSTVSASIVSGTTFDVESPAGIAQPEGPVRVVATKDDIQGPEATIAYVDVLAPLAPVIESVENDTGREGDGITADRTLAFHGTGEPGAEVVVFYEVGKQQIKIGYAVVGTDGRWCVDHTGMEFDPGQYVVKAQQTDINGGVSPHSSVFALTVDTSVPPSPVVISIAEEATLGPDTLTTSARTVTFYGLGEPGMRVDVYLDPTKGGDSIWLGHAAVQEDGTWRLDDTDVELSLGEYVVQANQTGINGVNSNLATGFTLKVVPQAPVISGVDEDTGESATDGVTSDTTLATYGTDGQPGALVELFRFDGIDSRRLGETRVEPDGTWRVDHRDFELARGEYELAARQTSVDGMVSEMSGGYQLVVKPDTSQTLSITGIDEDTGIRDNDGITMETAPAFWIEGGGIGNTLVVTVGGREVGRTVVESNSPMLARYRGEPLEDGEYEARVTEISAEGIASEASRPFAFVVDTVAPAVPAVAGITPDTGESAADGWTKANRLAIEGRGEPGEAVAVYVDGKMVGQTPVGPDGGWRFDHRRTALADGEHKITALQGDLAGNRSAMSKAFTVHVDQTADAPVIHGTGGAHGTVVPEASRPAVGLPDNSNPYLVRIEPTEPGSQDMGGPGTGAVTISRVIHTGGGFTSAPSAGGGTGAGLVSAGAGPVRQDPPLPEDDGDSASIGTPPPAVAAYQGDALPIFDVTATLTVSDCWAVQQAAATSGGDAADPFRQSALETGHGSGSCPASEPITNEGPEPGRGDTPSPVAATGGSGNNAAPLPTLDVSATFIVADRWHVQEASSGFEGNEPDPFRQSALESGDGALSAGPNPLTPQGFFTGIPVATSHDAASLPAVACGRSERAGEILDATGAFGLDGSGLPEMSELLTGDSPDEAGLAWAFPDPDIGLDSVAGHESLGSPLPDWNHAAFL